ncbi:MAG: hypothetical protein Fues2KO_52270 [Fuerstiella sp.]
MRKYGKWLLVLGILSANPAWVSADGLLSGLRSGQPNAGAQVQNQAKAQQVADALKQARINGYDLSVEVNGGTVKLDGKVRDVTHSTLAEQTVRKVTGVTQVVNKLKYVPTGAIQQTAGEMTDSGLRPAVYEQSAGSENSIEQVHFQKPGKRSQRSTASSSSGSTSGGLGGALSRFLPRRQATPTRSTQQRSAQTRQPSQPNRQTTSAGPATPRPQPPKAMAPPAAAAQPKSSDKPEALVRQTAAPAAFEPAPVNFATAAKPVAKPQATQAAPKTAAAPKAAPTPQAFATAAAPAQQQQKQPAAPQQSNQEVAQQIASYLAKVGLVGYDVEIRYDNGVATLNGDVATVQQLQAAAFAASQVDAVQNVQNNLKVKGPIAQASFAGAQNGGVRPVAMAMPAPMPAAMMAGMHPGAAPAPAPIGAAGNYSNPHLPNHAWPAYAAYPNSAAVSYPKQYSASAWPYIGPFYPYPQVPLGWREVSLQWDDGHWMIDFEKKKKAWYWLYHPKNWY